MSRIKEVTIGASRTLNLGNYNSIKIEGSATVEVDGNNVGHARETAINEVKIQLEEAYEKFKPAKK